MQHKTTYFNFARLVDQIKLAKLEGTYLKLLNKIEKSDLLIPDAFGLCLLRPCKNCPRGYVKLKYDKTSLIIAV